MRYSNEQYEKLQRMFKDQFNLTLGSSEIMLYNLIDLNIISEKEYIRLRNIWINPYSSKGISNNNAYLLFINLMIEIVNNYSKNNSK